jgi:hypothetical protein
MNWIIENYDLILMAVSALVAAGAAIAKLTKTDKDDKFFKRLGNLLRKP